MTAQSIAMEKTIEASELLEMVVETEARAGARGLSVAGGGKGGLFVKDVLKDSPAARGLSLQEGDQLLSARVYFDNIKYEDALQILRCAEPYRISFCLKRVVPSADVSRRPGATAFEVKGPKAKMAKLNIQSLSSLKRRKKKRRRRMVAQGLQEAEAHLAAGKPEGTPVDVEFAFPTFSKLRKARSAGEAAEASSGLWRKSSTLETKRRRLRFPRLKVKEAAAARVEGAEAHLARGLPHVGLALKEAGRAGGEGSLFRFTIPFSKTQKLKEDMGPKRGVGFQAPQVELALPLPRTGAEKGSLQVSAKVEAALPRGSSAAALEAQTGLKLPAAEVAAPQVDVDLDLTQLECAAPKGEGFRIRVPKLVVSADEAAQKLPLMKAPALEVALGESQGKASAEQPRPGGLVPSLGLVAPTVALELPFPMEGKAGVESPEISGRGPLLSLSQRGCKAQAGGAGRLPQVEVSVGKAESPDAGRAEGPTVQLPGLAISLRGQRPESQEAAGVAGDGQVKFPEGRMPSLGLSAPRVLDVHLCKAVGKPAAPSGRAKPTEAAEGAGLKFQMPQISLPKFNLPVETAPSTPPVQVKMPRPGGDLGTKAGLPKVGFSWPAVNVPGGPLPKGPKPELGLCVEKPEVEMAVSPALPAFPSAALPALDLELPNVGIELHLEKHERGASEQGPGFGVEIGLPTCAVSQVELEPGRRSTEGPALVGMVAQIPKVNLAFEKWPAEAEGPKTASEGGARMQLPAVEIPPGSLLEKPSRFALPNLSLSGPKVRTKTSPGVSAPGVEGADTAGLDSKLKLRKFGISFPKARWEDEAGDVKLAPGVAEGEAPEERPGRTTGSKAKLPTVEVDLGRPPGSEGQSGGGEEGSPPELFDVKFKGPKVSLLWFGGKDKEGEWGTLESGEVTLQGRQEGLDPLRMAPFGLLRRGMGAKGKKAPGSPKEKPKGPFGKMPQLKLSSLKAHGEGREGRLPAPELDGKALPQVELPQLDPRAGTGLAPEPGGPGFRVQVPPVEIAMPGSRLEGEAARAESQGPSRPSIEVSAPTLQLDVGLPGAGREGGILQAAPGTEAKIKLPKVELAKPGRGEEAGTEAALQLLGKGGEEEGTEATALGTKARLPKVDLSLPRSWLLPEVGLEGPESKRPSVGRPKLSAPKVRAPELELAKVGLEWGGGAPKATGDSPSGEGSESEASGGGMGGEDLSRVPQLKLKPPQLPRGMEALGHGAWAKEGWLKVPALGLGKPATEAGAATGEGRFRLKLPSLGISRPEAKLSLDGRPLCPPAQEAGAAFQMPQVALPEVGFSGAQEPGGEAQVAGAAAGLEGGLMKMPQIGIIGAKGGMEGATSPSQRGNAGGAEPEGRRPAFEVPGLEISTPSLKTHAEYEVGGPHRGPPEGWKRTEDRLDTGKWHRLRIPRFALFLPKAELVAPEGLTGQETGAKGGLLALRKPREEEGSAGLLEGEGESQAKPLKAKLRAPFALSLSRSKWGVELCGEGEEVSSKLRAPKLGFSKAEGAEVLLQDGAGRLGKILLPQVELLSPSKGAGTDPELSLKLVKADEAQEEAHRGPTISATLKAAKFKPPRISLPGFKKHNREPTPEAVTAVPPAEVASWETAAQGEPPSKFGFPKVALSSRSQGTPEISGPQQDQGAPSFRLPAFSAENGPEEGAPTPRSQGERRPSEARAPQSDTHCAQH